MGERQVTRRYSTVKTKVDTGDPWKSRTTESLSSQPIEIDGPRGGNGHPWEQSCCQVNGLLIPRCYLPRRFLLPNNLFFSKLRPWCASRRFTCKFRVQRARIVIKMLSARVCAGITRIYSEAAVFRAETSLYVTWSRGFWSGRYSTWTQKSKGFWDGDGILLSSQEIIDRL